MPDFSEIFVPQAGLLEMMIRGTVIYWVLFLLLRMVGRRDMGSLGTADLLVLVLVADAAGDAMSGGSPSVTDGIYVVATIVLWSAIVDRVCYEVPAINRLLEPDRVRLVRDGRIDRPGMRRAQVTHGELMEQLRLKGVASISDVRRAYLESTGEISVIAMDEKIQAGTSTLEEE